MLLKKNKCILKLVFFKFYQKNSHIYLFSIFSAVATASKGSLLSDHGT